MLDSALNSKLTLPMQVVKAMQSYAACEADERVCSDAILKAVEDLQIAVRSQSVIRCTDNTALPRTEFAKETLRELAHIKVRIQARRRALANERSDVLKRFPCLAACRKVVQEQLDAVCQKRQRLEAEREKLDAEHAQLQQAFMWCETLFKQDESSLSSQESFSSVVSTSVMDDTEPWTNPQEDWIETPIDPNTK